VGGLSKGKVCEMSEALFKLSGLRFWHESELELRGAFQARLASAVRRTLFDINPSWKIARCEGPILHPRSKINASYDDSDIFVTNDIRGGEALCLRAETTESSYTYARWLQKTHNAKLPLCVWQSGISSRRETNDGASAPKLRFNNFWQLEFQCIYPASWSGGCPRDKLMEVVATEIRRFTGADTQQILSDRLPSYSESTIDIEALHNGKWREMASCSIRNDYSADTKVCEIAIGLCRVATLAGELR
jgi:glycyl-tRNA synthetase